MDRVLQTGKSMEPWAGRLGWSGKLKLAAVAWLEYRRVVVELRRASLPEVVRRLEGAPHRAGLPPLEPRRLGRSIYRVLNAGPLHPRCLTISLVLFRMLARQGTEAQLVIGLPPSPSSHEAHAWVEVAGEEVGPPPGRLGHEELARYGRREAPKA